jgi:hypothetical protein
MMPTLMGREDAFTRTGLVTVIFSLLLIAVILTLSQNQIKRRVLQHVCRENLTHIAVALREHGTADYFPPALSVTNGGTKELVDLGHVFVHFQVLSNAIDPKYLVCPADKQKVMATNFDASFSDMNVSYFMSVDATEYHIPMFGVGDRNLTANGKPLEKGLFVLTKSTSLSWTTNIHNSYGNIMLNDLSVCTLSSRELAVANQKQNLATNRLAIP